MKTCGQCGQTKPVHDYYWWNNRPLSRCKACDRENAAARYTPAPRIPKQCPMCGTTFTRTAKATHCSKTCTDKARRYKNPAINKHKQHRRRTRTRNTDLTHHDIAAMLTAATTCSLCQTTMTNEYGRHQKNIDHIIPINIGGTHTRGNLRIICRTCNISRPNDGSDINAHQPTLWATDQRAAHAATSLRQTRTRRPPTPRAIATSQRTRATTLKHQLWTERAKAAAIARSLGWSWQHIADTLGYASTGAAFNSIRLRLNVDPRNL